jgi:hypothetical protein
LEPAGVLGLQITLLDKHAANHLVVIGLDAIAQAKFTKKTLHTSQATSERVQLLRAEYWAQVKNIDPKDLVFLDEMGVLHELIRTHARNASGESADDFKTFYQGGKVSIIGAISVSKGLTVMTIDDSMDA